MKILYKRIETDTGARYEFQLGKVEEAEPQCCEAMNNAWLEEIMQFDWEAKTPDDIFCIVDTSYYGGEEERTCYPIRFCPFCGEKIEPVMIQHVRLVKTVTYTEKTVREAHTTTCEEPVNDT